MLRPVYVLLGVVCLLFAAVNAIHLAAEFLGLGPEAFFTGLGTGGAYVSFHQARKPRELTP